MKRIVVQQDRERTQIALLEQERLIEFAAEDHEYDGQLLGNYYKGRIVNVLPGMDAAFVDIGLKKNAFLHIDDLLPAHLEKHPKKKPSIEQLVQIGQELLVQVTKEPLGTKGARVTTHYSLPGRWLVYMPHADYVGVSRKIETEEERERLKQFGEQFRQDEEGLILRTAANGVAETSLQTDLEKLRERWHQLSRAVASADAPAQIFQELDMLPRMVRDLFTEDVEEVILNRKQAADEVIRYTSSYSPELAGRVRAENHHALFDKFGIQQEIEQLFQPRVWLKSGGYLHLDHTEALTVFDVNTGKYTGSVELEETVFHTNLEAAEMIARLLRVRDIGGLIIIDFIDMKKEAHREAVFEKLETCMKQDRTKSIVVGWTQLGLLEMTRKKVREHKSELGYSTCPTCAGLGLIQKHIAYLDEV
ncbi:Rne/Rng family ribonuclease [Marinicrinis sediminis]|uniref:Rne/Rng family ribonuclease n=1 Tax=Marinicrinis sediminis TaxID=1652465 RepID=A0ABW5R631_9BACL